jgi:hypothetical protein
MIKNLAPFAFCWFLMDERLVKVAVLLFQYVAHYEI